MIMIKYRFYDDLFEVVFIENDFFFREIVGEYGVVVIDCFWVRLEDIFFFRMRGGYFRFFFYLVVINLINYGKSCILFCVEVYVVVFYIIGSNKMMIVIDRGNYKLMYFYFERKVIYYICVIL